MTKVFTPVLLLGALLLGGPCGVQAQEQPVPDVPKAPTVPDRHQHRRIGDWEVVLDATSQVLWVSLPEDVDWDAGWGEGSRHGTSYEPEISPVPATGKFVSIGLLGVKAKAFDDGLYAAVELAAQHGVPGRPGKREGLSKLCAALTSEGACAEGNAPSVVFAASALGGNGDRLPACLRTAVPRLLTGFRATPWASTPLGFYSWTPDLARVFQQDRMLQTPLEDAAGIQAVVGALRRSPDARRIYEQSLDLAQRLTNPFAYPSLADVLDGRMDASARGLHLLPPSKSHESELAKELWGGRSVPEGASLVSELVLRVRDGRISLAPTASSGWYDHQTWALEPLLKPEQMPEAAQVRYSDTYRSYLEETFKALLGLTRETHVKQVESPTVGSPLPPPLEIYPELTLEPLPTHYERKAASYAFVRAVLLDQFGEQALSAMHRLTPAGPVATDLLRELHFMEALFRGAAQMARYEAGLPRGDGTADADRALFGRWAAQAGRDPDVGRDTRMMVPVFHDIERKKTKVWVFLGWLQRPLRAGYEKPPRVVSARYQGKPVAEPETAWDERWASIAYPVVAEVYVTKPMDRAAFRRHCDRFKTRTAILENLR